MKKNLALISTLCALSLFACGDKDKGKTTDNNKQTVTKTDDGKSDHDGQSDSNGKSDDDKSDVDETFIEPVIHEGEDCNTEGAVACYNNQAFDCSEKESEQGFAWRLLEICDSDTICAISSDWYSCAEPCNPATDTNNNVYCEEWEYYYLQSTFTCISNNGKSYWKETQKECTSCGANNECIISDEALGKNKQPGDACNLYFFENRCTANNQAINCIQVDNNEIGSVVVESCSNCGLSVNRYNDKPTAYCKEHCAQADYILTLDYFNQDADNCYSFYQELSCESGQAKNTDFQLRDKISLSDPTCQALEITCKSYNLTIEEAFNIHQQEIETFCDLNSPEYDATNCDDLIGNRIGICILESDPLSITIK